MRFVAGVTFAVLAALWMLLNAVSASRTPPPPIAVSVYALSDADASLSLDDVVRRKSANFRRVAAPRPQSSAEWYRFVPPQTPGDTLVLWLNGAPDQADLYFPRADGSYGLISFGERRPFVQRQFASPFTATNMPQQSRTGKPVYLRTHGVIGEYGTFEPLLLETLSAYDAHRLTQTSGTLAFVGFFAAMGLVSAFLGLYLRERMFAMHALLMVAVILWDLTEKFLAWQFLWPYGSIDFVTAENLTFNAYLFVLLLFARSFLSLDRTLPLVDRALWVIFGLNVVTSFIALPLGAGSALQTGQRILQFLPFVVLPVAGAIRWRAGFRQARFFVLGFAGLFVVFLTAFLFGSAPLSPWAIDNGVAFESLLFQFAVADRMLSIMRERDEAQRSSIAAQEELAVNQREAIEHLETYNVAFSRFVPREFLTQLGCRDPVSVRLGDSVAEQMTVLFADVRGFTKLAETLSPAETFAFINEYLAHVGPEIRTHGGFVDKYIGDGILALYPESADNAIDGAIALHHAVRRFNETRARSLLAPISIGVGLHRGQVMLGTIGDQQRYETTVIADAVNVAARLEEATKVFRARIVASGTVVKALTNPGSFRLRPLAPVHVRGASQIVDVFEVCDADDPEILLLKVATLEVFESGLRAFLANDFQTSKASFAEVLRRNEKDGPAAYFLEASVRGIPV